MDQKMEFCLRAIRGSNFRELCRSYGISAKTGYKLRERFLERGSVGLEELSRRPHSQPEQLAVEEVCAIVRLKQEFPYWGARKLQALYGRRYRQAVSESTIKRILERSGLVHKRKERKASQTGRLSSGRKAQGATSRTRTGHSRSTPARGDYGQVWTPSPNDFPRANAAGISAEKKTLKM